MVQAPLGTYTGWNPRKKGHGHGAQWRFEGSYIPFPDTEAERQMTVDPRISIQQRYGTVEHYISAIRKAAQTLAAQGLLLDEDIERCAEAAQNWCPARHIVDLDGTEDPD
jgi:hypothetical protein